MPAVLRPALRCVTRRTLTSVFDRLRSINFCRLRTRLQVPVLRRLEDPSPQSPYVVLDRAPVNGVPVEVVVLRSVHRGDVAARRAAVPPSSCPTCPSVPASPSHRSKGSPGPRQHPFGSGQSARYPASYPGHRWRDGVHRPGFLLPFGHRHSLLGPSCSRRGVRPSSRSAYRPSDARTRTGFPRSTRARHDRGGCRLYPGSGGVPATDQVPPVAACRFPAASPAPRHRHPSIRGSP